ncbi:lysM and putative peptidoglycan-binding domain-containing protein 2-like isoform X1 [Lineus longissimus]|uniref:lysM and putative peptidoglycan-binding domain-containing protein 2-like isoform X1 n=1 Tax=Lineus longissimus TaxID=88925 RepID=UPI00315D903B
MAEGGRSEKSLLGKFANNQRKYGSTTNSTRRNETYIQHKLVEGDTLQGLALKYGVTMEDIKRCNKMWTNDSLYLRETLLIPIPTNPFEQGTFVNSNGVSTSMPSTSKSTTDSHSPRDGQTSPKSTRSKSPKGAEKDSEKPKVPEVSPNDFLSKFDTNLASIRTNVTNMEKNATFLNDDKDNPLNLLPHRKNTKYLRPHRPSLDSVHSDDQSSSPELVIKSKVRSRQIRTSTNRFETTEEQMFEL